MNVDRRRERKTWQAKFDNGALEYVKAYLIVTVVYFAVIDGFLTREYMNKFHSYAFSFHTFVEHLFRIYSTEITLV